MKQAFHCSPRCCSGHGSGSPSEGADPRPVSHALKPVRASTSILLGALVRRIGHPFHSDCNFCSVGREHSVSPAASFFDNQYHFTRAADRADTRPRLLVVPWVTTLKQAFLLFSSRLSVLPGTFAPYFRFISYHLILHLHLRLNMHEILMRQIYLARL